MKESKKPPFPGRGDIVGGRSGRRLYLACLLLTLLALQIWCCRRAKSLFGRAIHGAAGAAPQAECAALDAHDLHIV